MNKVSDETEAHQMKYIMMLASDAPSEMPRETRTQRTLPVNSMSSVSTRRGANVNAIIVM